jgi:hypothetical protein
MLRKVSSIFTGSLISCLFLFRIGAASSRSKAFNDSPRTFATAFLMPSWAVSWLKSHQLRIGLNRRSLFYVTVE